jgi:hypothetical protein
MNLSDQFKNTLPVANDEQLKPSSAEMAKSETRVNIDIQVSTAKKYPRNLKAVMDNIEFLATQDRETAESCFYALKRDGKTIRGGSVRLAEIIAYCYGNIRASARIISNDGKTVTAQGIAWDLENNAAYDIEVVRRITDKNGYTFSEDMQVVTANACLSIAMRNAIFKCVPLALTSRAQDKIKLVMMGEENDFVTTRDAAVEYFVERGIPVKNIVRLFDKNSVSELTREDIFDLRGIATAIKDGDTTLAEAFAMPTKPTAIGKAHRSLSVPIDEHTQEATIVETHQKPTMSEPKAEPKGEPQGELKNESQTTQTLFDGQNNEASK